MPVIEQSSYKAPFLFSNPHLQTVYSSLWRKVRGVIYSRERIITQDGDFVDIDFSTVGSRRLVLISHGLEGNSYSSHVLGLAKRMNREGFDAACWNYRGCSGEANRTLRGYHSGCTDDLQDVITHVTASGRYDLIVLAGFSIGGNLVLKYLGESGSAVDSRVALAITFSVPCDLKDSAEKLALPVNRLYMQDFLRYLKRKIDAKKALFPDALDDRDFWKIRSFKEYDDRFTAPLHGFQSAEDYWTRCSCRQFLPAVRIPALIVNSLDDPFFGAGCFPLKESYESSFVTLETPRHGGHLGFITFNRSGDYWSEDRTVEFLRRELGLDSGAQRVDSSSTGADLSLHPGDQ